jgi:hypothetical protein
VSDTDTALVDSLKVLDPERPIREADIGCEVGLDASVANDPTATFDDRGDTLDPDVC